MRLIVLSLPLWLLPGGALHADVPKPLNLLVITADDMNADSAGWTGNKLGATPHLDAFAKTAHRFVNSHVTVPICQPCRSALLTGRVPHRNGALGFNPIRRDVPTLVEILREAGYFTGVIAKAVHMAPPEKFPWHAVGEQALGKQPGKFAEKLREMLATAASEKKPFFINANICDPHRPFILPATKADALEGARIYKPEEVTVPAFLEEIPRVREEVAHYYSSVSRFDVAFGLVMKELTAAGRDADTVVVFLSDHGMSFPFSKATVYHNGTWSPVLIRIPGTKDPQTRLEFVSSVDVMPSLLELLDVKPPAGMDGRSWLPLLRGEKQADRDFVVTHVNTVSSGKSFAQRCIRTKDRALMLHGWVGGLDKFRVEAMNGLSFAAMNTSGDAKIQARVKQLVEGEKLMLFDLVSDPTERKNLVKDPKYAGDLAELSKKLLAHMKGTDDPQTKAFETALVLGETPGKKPNVVVILADDLGYGDVGCYNPERGKIPTPRIDQLAKESMRFTDAHSSSGVCSPTRYSLLTGRYHWRTRLQSGIVGVWGAPLIAADRLTIAGLAKQQGYHTACVGKWHLGWDWPIAADEIKHFRNLGGQAGGGGKVNTETTPEQVAAWKKVFEQKIAGGPTTRGFDEYFGTDVPNWPPYCYIENDRTVGVPSVLQPAADFVKNQASLQGPALPGWKLDAILPALAERACDIIAKQAKAEKPFLLYLPLTAPHTPIAVAKDWQGKSDLKHPYADFVMQTDATVGKVLDALAKAGVADNTLVIFTSDNGCASYIGVADLEAKGHFPSGPLRGYKASAWEGGHRIPFVVRWPDQVKAGTTCAQTISSVDILATLAEVWGAKLPATAGEDSASLLPLLRGEDRPIHEAVVHHSSAGIFAVRSGKWKLILGPGTGNANATKPHLYDLSADLGETKDLAAAQPDEVKRLTEIMQRFIADGRSTPGEKQKNDVPVRLIKSP